MVKFATGFGTAPPATDSSEAGPRGEEGFYRHFGTGTLPTGTSGAPSRGKGRLLAGLRHSDPTHRCLRDIPAWRIGLLSALWHRNPTHRYLRGNLAWQRETSDRSSAQRPYPQVPQRHPRVAKRASIGTLARRPLPQVPQWHPRGATVRWCIGYKPCWAS